VGKDSRPSTSTSHPLASPSQGFVSRGRTSFGVVSPSVVPARSAELQQADVYDNDEQGNVIISVRVRPETGLPEEDSTASTNAWYVDSKSNSITYTRGEGGDYIYDNVFADHDQNSRVYNASAKRLVRRVMEGYQGTVFAYGMTGSGKTFSMYGTSSSPGIIPMSVTDIFAFIRETPQREFLLRVSYLEVYNERIVDLLSTTTSKPGQKEEEIRLREDSRRGVYAAPLKEEIVQSQSQLLRVIKQGDQRRRTSNTQYNMRSSRSHAVVQIVVESRERNSLGTSVHSKRSAMLPGGVRISTLSLIDLAGSERAAETKERRTEGGHINKSLLTLGTVIASLSANKDNSAKDNKHIPYRDSKLTRLLQGALSGESLISILCTVQLGNNNVETLNTLKFAARARNNIVSHAKRAQEGQNANDPASRALLEMYRSEILDLRKQLDAQKKESQKSREEEEEKEQEAVAEARHEEHMLEMQLMRTSIKEKIQHLNDLVISSRSSGVNAKQSGYGRKSQRLSSGSTVASIYSRRSSRTRQSSSSTLGRADNDDTYSIGRATSAGEELYDDDSRSVSERGVDDDEEKIALQEQVRQLQAQLAGKDAHIATLEERVTRARKASRSRGRTKSSELLRDTARGWETVVEANDSEIQKRDAEIIELKEQLKDKDRMVVALRNMAKKRETAEASITSTATGVIAGKYQPAPAATRRPPPSPRAASSDAPAVPPLPKESISELLARRKASGVPSLRPRTSTYTSVKDAPTTPTTPVKEGRTYSSAFSTPPATPGLTSSPSSHQGKFFSVRRASLSSDEGRVLPAPPAANTYPDGTSRASSTTRSQSRSKSRRRSISSPGPIPLTLGSAFSQSSSEVPPLPKTPPPPPKSEKRLSKQVEANAAPAAVYESSPEVLKAQMAAVGQSGGKVSVDAAGSPVTGKAGAGENRDLATMIITAAHGGQHAF